MYKYQSTTVSGPSSISKYLKLSKGTLNSNGHVTLKSDASRDCLVHHALPAVLLMVILSFSGILVEVLVTDRCSYNQCHGCAS